MDSPNILYNEQLRQCFCVIDFELNNSIAKYLIATLSHTIAETCVDYVADGQYKQLNLDEAAELMDEVIHNSLKCEIAEIIMILNFRKVVVPIINKLKTIDGLDNLLYYIETVIPKCDLKVIVVQLVLDKKNIL